MGSISNQTELYKSAREYFKAALTGTNATGILCPRCKKHGRSNCLQSNGVLNYLRPVLGLERTVLLQGWSLQCIVCGEEKKRQEEAAKAAAAAQGAAYKPSRAHTTADDSIRNTWTSYDDEILEVLPPEVASKFGIVLNQGCAMLQEVFEDMVYAVTHGTSFSSWLASVEYRHRQQYLRTLEFWLDYALKAGGRLPRSGTAPSSSGAAVLPATAGANAGGSSASAAAAAAAAGSSDIGNAAAAAAAAGSSDIGNAAAAAAKDVSSDTTKAAAAAPKTGSSSVSAAAAAAKGSRQATVAAFLRPKPKQSDTSTAQQPDAATAARTEGKGGSSSKPAAGAASKGGSSRASKASGRGGLNVGDKRGSEVLADRAGFGNFEDAHGWCGYIPSSVSAIGLFLSKSQLDVAVASLRLLHVGGKWWKGDHSYKFTKSVRQSGEMVYGAVYTIMNEYNMVVAQWLMEDSTWSALYPKLQALVQRLQALGLETADIVYMDDPHSGQSTIVDVLGPGTEVKGDNYHGLNTVGRSLPPHCSIKSLLIGSLAHATLPPWEPDKEALRRYCTRGEIDGRRACEPIMSPAEYASKPYSFILKYSRRASGTRYEQAERVRKAIEQYKCARDPESGEIYLRPDGPAYAACMRFLRDVEAGLYEDPRPVDQMYRNTAWSNPGKLTKPASNRTTAQLEGYHGVILKELLQSANTSSELATKLLTLANKAYNMDREVVAGLATDHGSYDLDRLQRISYKLQQQGEPGLAGVGSDLLDLHQNGRLSMQLLLEKLQGLAVVEVQDGLLPATQADAAAAAEDADPEQEDEVAAVFYERQLQAGNQAFAGSTELMPTAPWEASITPNLSAAAATPAMAAASAAASAGVPAVGTEVTAAADTAELLAGAAGGTADLAETFAFLAGGDTDMPDAAEAHRAVATAGAAAVAGAPLTTPGAAGSSRTAGVLGEPAGAAALQPQVGAGHGLASLGIPSAAAAVQGRRGAKRSAHSTRVASFAELVRPVTGDKEWMVFKRLIRDCTTRAGTSYQRLGDLWDAEMGLDPTLTPKNTVVLKAAARELAQYYALRFTVHDMQVGPGAEGAAAAATTTAGATNRTGQGARTAAAAVGQPSSRLAAVGSASLAARHMPAGRGRQPGQQSGSAAALLPLQLGAQHSFGMLGLAMDSSVFGPALQAQAMAAAAHGPASNTPLAVGLTAPLGISPLAAAVNPQVLGLLTQQQQLQQQAALLQSLRPGVQHAQASAAAQGELDRVQQQQQQPQGGGVHNQHLVATLQGRAWALQQQQSALQQQQVAALLLQQQQHHRNVLAMMQQQQPEKAAAGQQQLASAAAQQQHLPSAAEQRQRLADAAASADQQQ